MRRRKKECSEWTEENDIKYICFGQKRNGQFHWRRWNCNSLSKKKYCKRKSKKWKRKRNQNRFYVKKKKLVGQKKKIISKQANKQKR